MGKFAGASVKTLTEIGAHRQEMRRIIEAAKQGVGRLAPKLHHMIPDSLLKVLREEAPEVYKAVVGQRGEPNKFYIPEELHLFLHGEGRAGGWWNRAWHEFYASMKRRGLSVDKMIEELKQARESALAEFGIFRKEAGGYGALEWVQP